MRSHISVHRATTKYFLTRLFSKTRSKRKDFQEIVLLPWAQVTGRFRVPFISQNRGTNLRKSRMRKRTRTDLCWGRSVMSVPTRQLLQSVGLTAWGSGNGIPRTPLPKPPSNLHREARSFA